MACMIGAPDRRRQRRQQSGNLPLPAGEGTFWETWAKLRQIGEGRQAGEVIIEWDNNIDDSEDPDEHETGGEG